jgi:FkbM family methyltransferase
MENAFRREEKIILEYLESLEGMLRPLIVDVGGNKEAEISAPFIAKGWRALIVEPQVYCVSRLRSKFADLPNVQIIQAACSDKPGVMKLYRGQDGQGSEASTLNDRSDPWLDQARSSEFEMVNVRTLTSVLLEANILEQIGILKIDAESWDYFVLKGFDLIRFHPQVIVTEEYLWDIDGSIAKHNLLDAAGYINAGFVGYNSVWLSRTLGANSAMVRLIPWLSRVGRLPVGLGRIDLLEQTPIWDLKP